MRCNYNGDAVLSFEDDFRRCARSEQFSLNDERIRKILTDRYFHAGTRKIDCMGERSQNQPFRDKGSSLPKRRFQFPCCVNWQEGRCTRTPRNVLISTSAETVTETVLPSTAWGVTGTPIKHGLGDHGFCLVKRFYFPKIYFHVAA